MHPLATKFIANIELLAEKENCILWATDKTLAEELFISATFQTLWGHNPCNIYRLHGVKDWTAYWAKFCGDSDYNEILNRAANDKHTVLYDMQLKDGSKELVIDRSFHLTDNNGECLLIAGVVISTTKKNFNENKLMVISDKIDAISVKYYKLLTACYPASQTKSSHLLNQLSEKQLIICKYLFSGLTAKEIAKKMDLSFRTVEAHTESIKQVFQVKSKPELLTLALEKNWISINL